MLIADKCEQFIFDERTAKRSTCGVAMQLRNLVVRWNVGILLIKERRGIQPIRAAMNITASVQSVGAGGRAHVDVSPAGRALLSVVHRSIYPPLRHGFWRRSGQGLADGEINRRRTLNGRSAGAGGIGHSGIVYNSGRGYLARALAVEQIAGIDAIQQKAVAGVALAIGPDRLIS